MANDLTAEKINEGALETKTKAQPFSLSGLFNLNGHPKIPDSSSPLASLYHFYLRERSVAET